MTVHSTGLLESLSVSQAAILDSTGTQQGTLYAVQSGQVSVDVTAVPNKADDEDAGTWYYIKTAQVSIQGGFIPFSVLSWLTGSTVLSSAGSPDDYYAMPLWQRATTNKRPVSLALRCPAKDANGDVYTLDIVLYKVYLRGIEFGQVTYKQGVTISYQGNAVYSAVDESGKPLTDLTIGSIRATPGNITSQLIGKPVTVYLSSADTAHGNDAYKSLTAHVSSSDSASASQQLESFGHNTLSSADTAHAAEGTPKIGVTDADSAAASTESAHRSLAAFSPVLRGSGTLAATGAASGVVSGSKVLTGSGSLSGTGKIAGSKALSGSGTLTASPAHYLPPASAALSGSGTLTATGVDHKSGVTEASSGQPAVTEAVNTNPTTGVQSNTFSPGAGQLVTVAVVFSYGPSPTGGTITVKDSLGNTYQSITQATLASGYVVAGFFCFYYTSAHTGISVTATCTDTQTTVSCFIMPRLLVGAGSTQAGAHTSTTTSGETSLTTTKGSSMVYVLSASGGTATYSPDGATTQIAFWSDNQSGNSMGFGRLTTPPSSPGATGTFGFTGMGAAIAAEVTT